MPDGFQSLPTDFDQLELSEWGLDWGDVSQIRDKLALTPTVGLREAQDFIDFASKYSRRGRATQDRQ